MKPRSTRSKSPKQARHVEPAVHSLNPEFEAFDADPCRTAVAAELFARAARASDDEEALRLERVATVVRHCGEPRLKDWHTSSASDVFWQHCRYDRLCRRCCDDRADLIARQDAARIGRLLARYPRLTLVQGRLSLCDTRNLRDGVERLYQHWSEGVSACEHPWDLVVGGTASVHPHRGKSGMWRPHLHLLMLVDGVHGERADRMLVSELRLEHVRRSDNGWVGNSGGAEWFFRQFPGQHSKHAHLLRPIGVAPELQAFRTATYDATHILDAAEDRVDVFLELKNVKMRRMWGALVGASAEELQSEWDRIEAQSPEFRQPASLLNKERTPPGPSSSRPKPGPALIEIVDRRVERCDRVAKELRSIRDRRRTEE